MPRVVPSQVVELIDKLFPTAQENNRFTVSRGYQDRVAAIIELIEQIPPEFITLSQNDYNRFVLYIAAFKSAMTTHWPYREWAVNAFIEYGDSNPIQPIREALSKCPDEGISEKTKGLDYIKDTDFRQDLRIDISTAHQALQNGEWKASTVIGAAAIEALLLFTLQEIRNQEQNKFDTSIQPLIDNKKLSKATAKKLNKGILYEYISIAEQLNIIKKETAGHAMFAKDFRNLIHPGRSKRKMQTCTRGTAMSALAALELVNEDLEKYFKV